MTIRWYSHELTTFGPECQTERHEGSENASEFVEILIPGPDGESIRCWATCRECHNKMAESFTMEAEREDNAGA